MSAPALGRRFITLWIGQTLSAMGSTLSGVGVALAASPIRDQLRRTEPDERPTKAGADAEPVPV